MQIPHILQYLKLIVLALKPQPTDLHAAALVISMVSKVSRYHNILQCT